MRHRSAIMALALAGVMPASGVGQQPGPLASGMLVAEGNGPGVSGAAVYLLTEELKPEAVVLSDAQGQFVLSAPHSGDYRLRVDRIGFATELSDVFTIPDAGITDLEMVLRIQPLQLEALSVSAERVCDLDNQSGPLVQVWSEARKALVATMISGAQSDLVFTVALSENELERDLEVKESRVDTLTVLANHAFEFIPVAELDSVGWARMENGVISRFYAPSPNALLDPWFGSTHCLSLAPSRSDRVTGIAFESIEGSLEVGMEGVFWLDDDSWTLQEIEFRFTGVEDLRNAKHQGGRIVLRTGDAGDWYVSEWQMRSPILRPGRLEWTSRRAGHRVATRRYRVLGYIERAGRVLNHEPPTES